MSAKFKCFMWVTGAVCAVSTAGLSASNDTDADYRKGYPYMTLRGGWPFRGSSEGESRAVKSAWSGSGEIGFSFFDDRLFAGVELGYFTGKVKVFEKTFNRPVRSPDGRFDISYESQKFESDVFFGTCNVTLQHELGDRAFVYGGIGAGAARLASDFKVYDRGTIVATGAPVEGEKRWDSDTWFFLGQAFAGFGVYLDDFWSLTAGYRFRLLHKHGTLHIHAAEIGLRYQF